MSAPIYIFAGGGTGGHLFPALAVAERLAAIQPQARVVFACSNREIDRRILSATTFPFVPQAVRPLPRSAWGWGAFLGGWWSSRRLAADLLRDLRPAAVLALGGFAAVPVAEAAARAGVPVGLLSIDALPGLANRHLARRADAIFTQFAQTQRRYGRWGFKARQVGCPVRQALLSAGGQQGRRFFGLREDRRTLLAMSGSLGAASINGAMAAIAPELDRLADRWQLLHLAGPGKLSQAAHSGGLHRVAVEFCQRMDMAYAAADLVLCRAGASTVGELTATGRPAVLVPYPHHRDRHQWLNAEEMVAAGAAAVIADRSDPALNAAALRSSLLEVMSRPERLAGMAAAAAGLARRDAAGQIAAWLAG